MVKKISAIFLALVLCLSVMVVPVSALETGKTLGLVLRADKTEAEIVPGAVVTVYFHFDLADYDQLMSDMRLCLVYDSSVYTPDPSTRTFLNDLADYAKDATAAKVQATFGQTCLTAAGATADELALYDGGVMIQIGADVNLGANSKRGFLMTEGDDGVSVAQLSMEFTVTGDEAAIAAGSKNIIWPATIASANQYIKYTDGSSTPKQYATSDADFTKNNIIANMPACEHPTTEWKETTAPTCGDEGVETEYCTVCTKETGETRIVAATGNHTAGDPIEKNIVEPSCNTAGSKDVVVYCSVCETEMSRATTEIPATGEHNFATEVERVEPKCTEDGYYVMACGCGERAEPVTLPAAGHDYESEVTAPTCTEDGYTTYTCACGDTYTADEVEATGHDMQETAKEVAPTCTEAGKTAVLTCANGCGTTEGGEPVDALGHEMTADKVVAPTCTEAGYTVYTCANGCGTTENKDETEATGHNHAAKVTKQPSCTRAGTMTYECACGDKYTETIPARNHKNADGSSAEVEIPAVEPTCSEYGYTAGAICTLCNTQTIVPTQVPKADHAWDDGVVTEPTYEAQGYTTYTCTACGETKEDDFVPALTPDEPDTPDEPGTPDTPETGSVFAIKEPSVKKLRFMDEMLLHTVMPADAPEGSYVTWEATEGADFFKIMEDNGDGKVRITPKNEGWTTFKATLCDANGNVLATDEVEMFSRAHLFDKIGGIFRYIFGSNIKYEK